MKAFPIFLMVLLGVALVYQGGQSAETKAKDSSNTGSLIDGE